MVLMLMVMVMMILVIIIIREFCKSPTPCLKALNKYNTHNVRQDGKWHQQFNKKLTRNADIKKGSRVTM